VNVSGIGPGGKTGDDVELAKKAADNLIGITFRAEPIELRHHLRERLLHIGDGAVGKVLTLLLQAAFALGKFFAIEIRDGMEGWVALRARIGQEARQTVPRRRHI